MILRFFKKLSNLGLWIFKKCENKCTLVDKHTYRKKMNDLTVYTFNSELSKSLSKSMNLAKALDFDRHLRRMLTLLWKVTKLNVSLYFLLVLGEAAEVVEDTDVADEEDRGVCPVEAPASLMSCNLLMLLQACWKVNFQLNATCEVDLCAAAVPCLVTAPSACVGGREQQSREKK